ncbi:MAG: alpha/beta hydrolase [Chloroflexi bacterium]|nr:alpha/beta hydrolase [Chloroflexota bacterium]
MASTAFAPTAFVELPAGRMAYREWGSRAAPPLLLIHGITGSSLTWWRVGPALADQFHVVAIDQKGHGDSWKPADGYRYLDQAREAAVCCDMLGLEQPVVIGHSWGGGVALALATSTDLTVSRLVLEDPALGGQQATAEQHQQRRREFLARVGLDQAAAEAYARSHRLSWWSDEDAAARIDAACKGSPTAVAAVLEASDRDGRALLGRLRSPTLLVRGEPELGGIVDPETVRIAEQNPVIRVRTIPGAEHSVHGSRFEPFMAQVRAFLSAR